MKFFTVFLASLTSVAALTPKYQYLPPLREQAELQDKLTAERKEAIPGLLEKHGVDEWIVC